MIWPDKQYVSAADDARKYNDWRLSLTAPRIGQQIPTRAYGLVTIQDVRKCKNNHPSTYVVTFSSATHVGTLLVSELAKTVCYPMLDNA